MFESPWEEYPCLRKLNSFHFIIIAVILIIFIILLVLILYSGKCSSWDVGTATVSTTQGSFCPVQLFGDWTHQVQWGAEGLL